MNSKTPAKTSFVHWQGTHSIPGDTDILVNATSIGLFPKVRERPDINHDSIHSKMVVCDVIHTPMTPFLKEAQNRGAKIVDGRGALRVCQLMRAELGVAASAEQPAELTLRPAEPADVHALFAWANDAVTRSSSFSAAAIPFEQHVAWFSRTLEDSTSTLLIGELPCEGAIGQVRLARRASGDAVISVGLAPEARGRGFGGRLLEAAATRYCSAHPDCERIAAYVKPSNAASIAAFRRAGFSAPVADRFDQHECVRLDYRCVSPASATKPVTKVSP